MPPLVPLVRIELHSLGLGVSVFPLVPLVAVELHLLATVYIDRVTASIAKIFPLSGTCNR